VKPDAVDQMWLVEDEFLYRSRISAMPLLQST